ncbi:hypothetical protein CVT24_000050 [Panaeolus cyanescens]|uniref:N-acetyltransferase domain-containing protein n=1 Tax=Panaeolus cyanescens TaxID=181874 RepID=A0A409VWD0_9AGAR|nr:hypothetical protein CVT24_000050 [Panaeolus cyanescens]
MPQHSVVLESPWKRIKLGPPSVKFNEDVARCRAHPRTRQYLPFLPEVVTAEDIQHRMETRAEDPKIMDFYIFLTEDNSTEKFAGNTGYFNIDHTHASCEVGIVVSPDIHGKSIATETFYVLLQYIFEEQGFHRATFETGADNVPMQRWFENVAGIRKEGERKECWKADGRYFDVMSYAVLDWEWKGRVKSSLAKRLNAI